jgi:acyl carrier protein
VGNESGHVPDTNSIVLRREFPLLGPYVAPRTATERKLAEIWCHALGMDQVSVNDNFEELGGDSLLAVSIFAEIEAGFGIPVPIGSISRSPTVAQLSQVIDGLAAKREK